MSDCLEPHGLEHARLLCPVLSLSSAIYELKFMFIESVTPSNHLTKKIEFPVNLNPDLAQG